MIKAIIFDFDGVVYTEQQKFSVAMNFGYANYSLEK